MIDAGKLARIRRRVVGGYLAGLGYESSGNRYLAKMGPQLRYVRFSAGTLAEVRGGRLLPKKVFDVEIALHLDFLPPFRFAAWPGARIPAEMCGEVCAFQRLVRTRGGSQYYEYGETAQEAVEMLRDIAERVAQGLDEIGATCGDGQRLLELISPRVLTDDLAIFKRLLKAGSIEDQHRLSESMQIRQVMPEWYPHITPTGILLAYLASRYGRLDLIPAYVAVAKAGRLEPSHLPYIEDLERLQRRR